jgi:anthranilate synthase component 2
MAPIILPIEHFTPSNLRYGRVTLIDAYDSFTHNLAMAFCTLGAPVTVMRSKEITFDDVDTHLGNYLVFSPGPGTPSDAGLYKELILKYYKKVPILGVCLGMQAINEVFGGKTAPAPEPMHGKTSLVPHDGTGVFQNIPSPTIVARYHSLACFEISQQFILQSQTEPPNPIPMAFHEPPYIAAVQFHPESFLTKYGIQMLRNFLEGSI